MEIDIEEYELSAKTWVENFLSLYHDQFITPHIHAIARHVGDCIRIHGGILPFTQQGMEKLNIFL